VRGNLGFMIRTALVLFLLVLPLGADEEKKFTVVGTITGHDGKPVKGTTVKAIERESRLLVPWTKADKILPTAVGKDGKYTFTLERTGWYIIAEAPGHAETAHLADPAGRGSQPIRCDFRLPEALTIAGHVEDENGDPIVDAGVMVLPRFPGGRWSPTWPMTRDQFSRRTGADGKFAFRRVAAGIYEMRFIAEARVIERIDEVAAGRKDLKIVLRPGKVIRGRVVDADGDPVEGALVQVRYGGERELFVHQTGPDGRFTTWLLHPDRTYTLYVTRRGPDPFKLGPRVDVKPGGKELTITLK